LGEVAEIRCKKHPQREVYGIRALRTILGGNLLP
jgi:hypothetical protein